MRFLEAMIAYNSGDDKAVEVGPWPDRTGWSKPYTYTTGACFMAVHKMSPAMQLAMLFIEFHTAAMRSGCDVKDVHEEFLKIDEYRWHIAPDFPGADDTPEWRTEELFGADS